MTDPNAATNDLNYRSKRAALLMTVIAGVAIALSGGQTIPTRTEIRVRLLDYKTLRAVKGRNVQLTLSDPDGEYSSRAVLLGGKTDANGVVVFRFDKMPPPRLAVIPLDDFPCVKGIEFAMADILHAGIAGQYADNSPLCKYHASELPTPHPGEIVFPVHRLNLWQRIRRSMAE